jgi:hypothetical protein
MELLSFAHCLGQHLSLPAVIAPSFTKARDWTVTFTNGYQALCHMLALVHPRLSSQEVAKPVMTHTKSLEGHLIDLRQFLVNESQGQQTPVGDLRQTFGAFKANPAHHHISERGLQLLERSHGTDGYPRDLTPVQIVEIVPE